MAENIDHDRRARRAMFYPKADLRLSDERLRSFRRPDTAEQTAAYREGLALVVRDGLSSSHAEAAQFDIQPLAEQGTFHRLFRIAFDDGRRIIARIAIAGLTEPHCDDYGNQSLLIDAWAHDRLRRAGLSGLEVYCVDTSQRLVPFSYELLSEAPGASLREFDHDDSLMQPLLIDLGRQLAQIHVVRGRGAGLITVEPGNSDPSPTMRGAHDAWPDYVLTQLDTHLAICRDLGAIDSNEVRRIEAVFASPDALPSAVPLVLLHGDLGNHNIFTDGRRITQLIDWEDCLFGDPLFDLAFCATFHPEHRHAWLLAGYREYVPLDATDLRRLQIYFLRIALAKTVLRRRLGIVDVPGRTPAAQRIQLALAALRTEVASSFYAA
ncbi:MAG: aminoglycoside phosphotransferase family protein [Planctomycetia bacterium]|nr:aminoglycoside phosphotransferase family protein [Planctomycetia bacterium]